MSERGAVRWFGESWGAPICDPDDHVATPAGDVCLECERVIGAHDQGLMIWFHFIDSEGEPRAEQRPWHLDCWLEHIGVTRGRRDLHVLAGAVALAGRGKE